MHLDIKPYNILFSGLNTDFGLKIIDFGLARDLGDEANIPVDKLQVRQSDR